MDRGFPKIWNYTTEILVFILEGKNLIHSRKKNPTYQERKILFILEGKKESIYSRMKKINIFKEYF